LQDLNNIRYTYLKLKGGQFSHKGNSMEPILRDGCTVDIKPVAPDDLKIGEVVVFSKNFPKDILVCHRIMGKFKRNKKIYYLEKGDNVDYVGVISADDIIGRVESIIDNGQMKHIDGYLATNKFFLNLVCRIIDFHNRASYNMKEVIFLGKKNKLTAFLGKAIWRFYCLILNLALKRQSD